MLTLQKSKLKKNSKKLLISTIILLVAIVGLILFSPFLIYEFLISITTIGLSTYFSNIAKSLDQLLNVLYKNTLDLLFIKNLENAKAKFGYADEKISSMLGYIQEEKNLSFLGKQLCNFLNFLEKDHCIKSISNDKEIYVKK